MMQQGVDERVFLVPGGRMHDEAGGLVDDEQRFVLEQDIERYLLRLRLGRSRFGKGDFNRVAGARNMRSLGGLAVDPDVALFDEPLHGPARGGRKFFAQKNIQTFAGARLFDREFFHVGGHDL